MRSTFDGFRAFAEEVARIETVKADYVAPMKQVAMVKPDRLQIGNIGEFGLTANGHRQLAEKTRIPFDYYERIGQVPGLREYNVNSLNANNPEEKRLLRTLDGNVRAVLGPRFKPLDNMMLLEALMPSLKDVVGSGDMLMKTQALTENHLYLQVVFPKTKRDLIQPGRHEFLKEPIQIMAGITIRNSETGHAALDIRRMTWNLVCWNGLIRESILRQYHLGRELDSGDNGNIWSEETLNKEIDLIRSKAKDIIADAMSPDSLDAFVEKAQAAIEHRVVVPTDQLVINVTKRFRSNLTEAEVKAAVENMLLGGQGNLNQWGLANGINGLASGAHAPTLVTNPDRQYDLERLAADVIELKPGEWEVLAAA